MFMRIQHLALNEDSSRLYRLPRSQCQKHQALNGVLFQPEKPVTKPPPPIRPTIEAMPIYQPLHRAVGEASTGGLGGNEGQPRNIAPNGNTRCGAALSGPPVSIRAVSMTRRETNQIVGTPIPNTKDRIRHNEPVKSKVSIPQRCTSQNGAEPRESAYGGITDQRAIEAQRRTSRVSKRSTGYREFAATMNPSTKDTVRS